MRKRRKQKGEEEDDENRGGEERSEEEEELGGEGRGRRGGGDSSPLQKALTQPPGMRLAEAPCHTWPCLAATPPHLQAPGYGTTQP